MEILKKKDFYILLLIGGLYGAAAGLIITGFMKLLELSTDFVWETLPGLAGVGETTRFLPLIITLAGGLLMGVLRKYLGDTPKPMHETLEEFSETGGFPYKTLPQSFLIAITSLVFGASLGPEAALISLLGGIGSLFADKLGRSVSLAALFPDREPKDRKWLIIPAIPALVAMVLLISLLGGMNGFSFDFGAYTPRFVDLLYGALIGGLTVFAGFFFTASESIFGDLMSPLSGKPVIQAVIGGLILGVVGSLLPETLFSGQKMLQPVFETASEYGFWMLMLIALVNILVTRVSLSAGWKGGQFFPLMFSGATIGLAVGLLLPGVTPLAALVAGMSGITLGVLGQPLFAMAIVVLMMPKAAAGVAVTATLAAYGVKILIEKIASAFRARRETLALEVTE